MVRTILSISDSEGSMTFAGDIPQGSKVRFMKANFDKLTSAAGDAAQQTMVDSATRPDLAILISCIGRNLILGPRT
ncbi:MAG: FIST C-terminal domain-containing protein, partial [Bacteroidia bacterium]